MLGPPRLGLCREMARDPQRTRVIPSGLSHSASSCCPQPRPLWSFGAVGQCPVGSAHQGHYPCAELGALAVLQSKWHLPTYLFPSGVTGQGWVGVPEWFLCSPPFVLVLNKHVMTRCQHSPVCSVPVEAGFPPTGKALGSLQGHHVPQGNGCGAQHLGHKQLRIRAWGVWVVPMPIPSPS